MRLFSRGESIVVVLRFFYVGFSLFKQNVRVSFIIPPSIPDMAQPLTPALGWTRDAVGRGNVPECP